MSDITNKKENRIMGDYSISKSYKGILRIAHILDLVEGDSVNFTDQFLNSTYYGDPTELMNISGGQIRSKEYGYQTPIKGMEGSIKRYTSQNNRFGNDDLRINRIPMTDSMGNYLNWNIGLDGITIGSNDDINGNSISLTSFRQRENPDEDFIQKVIFPIVTSKEMVIGLENKLLLSEKTGTNISSTEIESGSLPAMVIVENLYDKTDSNSTSTEYYTTSNGQNKVTTSTYNNIVGDNKKYDKLRTIYRISKAFPEEYDVLMYRQDDYDTNNWSGNSLPSNYTKNDWNEKINAHSSGKVLDTFVDITNLKEYVKNIISKYTKGNTVEVPSGSVIWQYCSLDKWRAFGDKGDIADLNSGSCYIGHRPTLQKKEKGDDSGDFFTSTIQGVCKKQNKISKTEKSNSEKNDDENMSLDDDSYKEIIPLYKRDYILCDGSKYRIPYIPNLKNSNLLVLKEHMDRFFELFFNIGYRYTKRENLAARPLVHQLSNGELRLVNANSGELNN